jgi:ATP-dependent helicase/nuclease subunit A
MKRIQNQMIRASAGTGKTYQLTNRFIRLLLCGLSPDRIIALTFTRKAAGEFFEGILTKLATAAVDPGQAKKLAREIDLQTAKPEQFREALRQLMEAMGQLSLGTI